MTTKEETMTTAVRTVRSAVGGRQCKRRKKMRRMRKRELTNMRRKRRMKLRRTANTTSRQL